ncbi:C2 family cysteine protease [Streptomyces noursei]
MSFGHPIFRRGEQADVSRIPIRPRTRQADRARRDQVRRLPLPFDQTWDLWDKSDESSEKSDQEYVAERFTPSQKLTEERYAGNRHSRAFDTDVAAFLKAMKSAAANITGKEVVLKIEAHRQGVGHCWITVSPSAGDEISLGFGGQGRPWGPGAAWLEGAEDVDRLRAGGAVSLSAELDAEGILRLAEYVAQTSGKNYSLHSFTCTTFAQGAFSAATGKVAPGLGHLGGAILPRWALKSIKRRNEEKNAEHMRQLSVRPRRKDGGRCELTEYSTSGLPLWGNQPKIEDIKQGQLGDCSYLAALAALVHINPKEIQDRITRTANGRFNVRLDREIEVGPLLPAENDDGNLYSLYARPAREAIWAPIMEKAMARRKSREDDNYASLNGSRINDAMEILGYKPVTYIYNCSARARQGLESGKITVAGTKPYMLYGKRVLKARHAYAVLSKTDDGFELYDPNGKRVNVPDRVFRREIAAVHIS